ncbi:MULTISPECIES: proteasome assembly chaperone family protein [Prauserella salsuginis group]|uniref:Proteasome assembly chaperone family protein n=2 Tax=Prauserella salsuginis group TaxID=2893672 RepID=A0ABW6GA42_9PSEU|nr:MULTISPECIES: PAC2 family protein [Prauserella salsuginis group]MBB3665309.1 putative ATP-grasp superfamily ATP-dependent carboligase [Prauserella sediminis]MCR3723056.1 putative ATP-dependent carboligase, ATP-grasp superfamily [Prauserella flava]MCR3732569.1 putative ATP-dependent carboligase, ATP-grasp superfamily [Prauserella salsuginis]
MTDADELYVVDSDVPVLDGAVLLYHLDGYVDAGSAGELLTEHLTETFDGPVVARFDVDRLIDYRSRRPAMTWDGDGWADYQVPELTVRLLHDADETPMLLLTGPEPDREWELFAEAVRRLVERWKVRLSVQFQGIPMAVPHTRPLGVTAHATRTELVRQFSPTFNRATVPGSAEALVEFRLGQAGHDAAGFAAHVPHYLAQSRYPVAALTLVDAVQKVAGLQLPDDALREAARRAEVEVERQVKDSDEAASVVHSLEEQYDAFTSAENNLLVGDAEMPTGDELATEFEQFLAQQPGSEQD